MPTVSSVPTSAVQRVSSESRKRFHHGRAMPSRSMRRYSAWRDRPSSAAACATTPPARLSAG
jgi:hypothetical protein